MKPVFLACTIILLSVAQCIAGDNYEVLWSKGNQFYHQRQYDSALACYQTIALAKPANAQLYYNLGNTYYRLNRIGGAVLNYEKALHLKPDYLEARENLILTQSRMSNHIYQANEVFFIEWWDSVTRGNNATLWAIWSIITFVSIIGLSMLIYFKIGAFPIPVQVPGVLAFVWLCFMVLAYNSAVNARGSGRAVVMQNDAPLMNLEQKAGKPLSLLPEGTTVKVAAVRGEYAEIVLPDGRRGWIELALLNKI